MMTEDEIQEKINLTPAQKKAWLELKKAFAKCKKEKIYLYHVLDSLYGLNGKNVVDIIVNCDAYDRNGVPESVLDSSRDLGQYIYPCIKTTCSYADDTHHVCFKEDIE